MSPCTVSPEITSVTPKSILLYNKIKGSALN